MAAFKAASLRIEEGIWFLMKRFGVVRPGFGVGVWRMMEDSDDIFLFFGGCLVVLFFRGK